ncbi:thiamine biosynthesis lipoprotein [Pedobacter psychrotolerans]|uniref:FAD:protein FMN transferase n=2 Tax=Pedobacter psychrotolerans TaxID=1843235 RepID=A0A4R2HLU4_9SPHI|nr:FAD:protein FMN transferase [Pedobacter psychrotolerans]TCO31048.1 thiamine biosynthesis lipoprotein [Pedobacter psychrotolerans]
MYKLLFLCLPLIFALFPADEMKSYKIKGFAQGTDYTIMYYAKDSVATKSDIDSLLKLIDQSMSLYQKGSLINQFNAAEKQIQTDRFLNAVLKRSFEINSDTKGIFDITVAPLVQAWGFGPKPVSAEPDEKEIKLILNRIGMQNLKLEKGLLIKTKPGIQIDLNGIAQGYSVDLIADYLNQKGIKSYLAELGGEIRVAGPKPDGTPMKIGIEGPDQNDEPDIRHIAVLNQGAITTSGNYRRFHQSGKKKISHLINAQTGYPLENEMISVTVYAADAITADGYDNALMGMHLHEALKFVEERPNLEAYFVYHKPDGTIADTLSTGFKKILKN